MDEKYTVREVHIKVAAGVTLVADVASISALKKLIADLTAEKLVTLDVSDDEGDESKTKTIMPTDDEPASRMELKASVTAGSLAKAKILAFKDGVPQLLRPNSFSNKTDAVLLLLFAVETGLKNPRIGYEAFKGLFESQNIKSGSPLAVILSNLKIAGYLDKRIYDDNRVLLLTAKGEKKSIEVMKSVCSS